jgi:hypothetical protein
VVQFSSAVPGQFDILFKETVGGWPRKKQIRAHYSIKTSIAALLDCQKDDKRILEIGKVKFHVKKLLTFVNENLKW